MIKNRYKSQDTRVKIDCRQGRFCSWLLILSSWLLVLGCNNKSKEVVAENEFYTCSMDPQVMEKEMGICPICKMPLTKVMIDKTQLHLIKLSDEQIKLGNIKTDTIKADSIWDEKTLTGIFAINQNSQQQISSRFNGRIEKLYFKIPGQDIKEGDHIYDVYSRELMQAQEEYLFAIERAKSFSLNSNSLIESSKNKLLLWGLTEGQLKELEERKEAKIINPIYSKASGTAVEIQYKEGDYIDEGSIIFKLADLSTLWVESQVYSNELDEISEGTKLEVIPESFPEEVIARTIDFSNPELQTQSKINLMRVKVSNERKQFIPGMMAYVIIKSKPKPGIVLPIDAVIQNKKKSHVWVRNKDGSFEAREVHTGIQTKTKIQILDGLTEGTDVVTSGAYLIYSDYVFKRGKYPLTEINTTKNEHQNH